MPAAEVGRRDGGGSEESAYPWAIRATLLAIQRRAATFRNQIVLVVLLSLASIVAAIVAGRAACLTGFTLLIPTVGFFFWRDHRILTRWRSGLLAHWHSRALDFEAYRAAMLVVPATPGGTLRSMLDTLPRAASLAAEQALPTPIRAAIADIMKRSDQWRAAQLLVQSTLFVLSTGALVSVAVMGWRTAWWVAALVVLVPVAALVLQRAQRQQVAYLIKSAAASGDDSTQLISALPAALLSLLAESGREQSPMK